MTATWTSTWRTISILMRNRLLTARHPTAGATTAVPKTFPAQPDRLYRNNGDGTFTDVSTAAGIDLPEGRGLGVLIAELTGDNRPDIYVANDGTPCWLFANRGNLRFEEIGEAAGVARDGQGQVDRRDGCRRRRPGRRRAGRPGRHQLLRPLDDRVSGSGESAGARIATRRAGSGLAAAHAASPRVRGRAGRLRRRRPSRPDPGQRPRARSARLGMPFAMRPTLLAQHRRAVRGCRRSGRRLVRPADPGPRPGRRRPRRRRPARCRRQCPRCPGRAVAQHLAKGTISSTSRSSIAPGGRPSVLASASRPAGASQVGSCRGRRQLSCVFASRDCISVSVPAQVGGTNRSRLAVGGIGILDEPAIAGSWSLADQARNRTADAVTSLRLRFVNHFEENRRPCRAERRLRTGTRLQCMEIWGGIEPVERTVSTPGLDLWVFSQPFQGDEQGGDVYYVTLCGGGLITRIVVADVSGHGSSVAEFSIVVAGVAAQEHQSEESEEARRAAQPPVCRRWPRCSGLRPPW